MEKSSGDDRNSFGQFLTENEMSENRKKLVHTGDYVKILEDLTQEDKTVGVPVSGNSMSPFLISHRDYVIFQKPNRSLQKGDIVFFRRDSGEYILHRVSKIRKNQYYILGDAQTKVEGPIREDQIFGLVTKARRKGKWIDPSNFWWKFFEKVWINMIPLRPVIRKLYGILTTR